MRRLPRWHWIRIVRVHGPKVPAIRAILFALAVRMDERGEAWPSQKLLAADIASTERTVREAVLEARRAAWLAVVDHVRPGQAWRLSHYIACVPNSLNLESVDLGKDADGNPIDVEGMALQWCAQYGEIDDRMHGLPSRARDRAKARRPKGAAITSPRKVNGTGQGPVNAGQSTEREDVNVTT